MELLIMYAIEILLGEHKLIGRFLNIIRAAAENIEKGKIFAEVLGGILDFLPFIECHMLKEEIVYSTLKTFKIPKRKDPRIIGVNDWYMFNVVILGDIRSMLTDHEEKRRIGEALVNAVKDYFEKEKDTKNEILHNFNLYIYLIFQHILKEDRTVYPRLKRVLNNEKQEEITLNFKEVENQMLKKELSEYLKLVKGLEDKLGIIYKEKQIPQNISLSRQRGYTNL